MAIHANRRTDFIAAVCAEHLYDWKGVAPEIGLQRAADAGLTITERVAELVGF